MPLNINDSEEKPLEEKPISSEIVPPPPEKRQNVSKIVPIFFTLLVLAAVVFLLYTYDIISIHKSTSVSEQFAQSKASQTTSEEEEEARDTAQAKHPAVVPKDTTVKVPAKVPAVSATPSNEKALKSKEQVAKPEEKNQGVSAMKQPAPKTAGEKPSTAVITSSKKELQTAQTSPESKKNTAMSPTAPKTSPPEKTLASKQPSPKNTGKQPASTGVTKSAIPPRTIGHLALYISSYRDRKYAEEDVARWREAGFDAFVFDNGEWHRVAIGRFNSVGDAEKQVDTLKQAFEYGYWIGPC